MTPGLRPHLNDSADCHERPADPHPRDERVEADSQRGTLGRLIAGDAGEDHVCIQPERLAQSDFRRRLGRRHAAAVDVLAPLAHNGPLRLSVTRDIEDDRGYLTIEDVEVGDPLADEAPLATERI